MFGSKIVPFLVLLLFLWLGADFHEQYMVKLIVKRIHFFSLLIFLVSILAQVANFSVFRLTLFQVLFSRLTVSKLGGIRC